MYSRRNRGLKRQVLLFAIYALLLGGIGAAGWYLDSIYYVFSENYEYDELIEQAAVKHNIDPLLVKAVIWRESRFNHRARGGAGEIGLMQIMPKSATSASVVEDWERANGTRIHSEGTLFYPEMNIEIGTWYLARAIRHWPEYEHKYEIGLAEYNAGKSKVNRWVGEMEIDDPFINRIGYTMTRDYVQAIMVKYNYYKAKKNEKY